MYDQLQERRMKHGNILRFYDNHTWAWSMECSHGSHDEEQKHPTGLTIKFLHCLFKDYLVNKARHEDTPLKRGDLFIF